MVSHLGTFGRLAFLLYQPSRFIFWIAPAHGDAAAAVRYRKKVLSRGVAPSAVPKVPSHPNSSSTPLSRHPAMSLHGPGRVQESNPPPTLTSLVNPSSDVLLGTDRRTKYRKKPSVQAVNKNKAQARPATTAFPTTPSPLPYLHTHASVIVGSAASTVYSSSELTSTSSGDLLPPSASAAKVRHSGSSHKQSSKNSRRTKSHDTHSRWTRNGTSSDDTGSDRKVSLSSSSRTSSYIPTNWPEAGSPSLATHNAAGYNRRLMAANFGGASGDSRRGVSSPRPKGRGMKV